MRSDIVGTKSLLCEIELIQLYDDVFTKLNISELKFVSIIEKY